MSESQQGRDVADYLNAAAACYREGRLGEAAALYQKAADAAPQDLRPIYSLALIDIRRGHLKSARQRLMAVAAQDPNHYPAQQNLGAVCQSLNLWQEAADAYARALRLKPDAAETHFSLARALTVLGRVEEAGACYRTLATHPSVRLRALTRLAALDPVKLDETDLAALQHAADDPMTAPATRIEAYFALGSCLEQRGKDQAAFAAFRTGNRLKHDTLTGLSDLTARPDALQREHERAARFVIERIDAAFLRRRSHGSPSAAPIFIIGMPRSGSSLIEQILSSHPRVQSMGESAALSTVVDRGFTESLASVNWGSLAEAYLGLMRQRGWQGSGCFVDKTLENHLRVGLIHLMFPKAVIIHSTRDPVDTCLSCYRQLFTEGNETLYDLSEIGQTYARYRRVMEHWERVLPGRVIKVEHEKLVADPQRQIRRLVSDACKLEWDPACLRFYEAAGAVRTASAAQVRRPMFQTSIGRWVRFAEHLEPLFASLGPYARPDPPPSDDAVNLQDGGHSET